MKSMLWRVDRKLRARKFACAQVDVTFQRQVEGVRASGRGWRIGGMTASTELTLFSDGLCSKWGFNDGDMPDDVWDWCDEHGIDGGSVDWHAVLRKLVREHLLPALAEHHDVEVYHIETHHNPIRASRIDGQEIDAYKGPAPDLTPEWVTVPAEVVAAVLRDPAMREPDMRTP
jgi:hypothetical protein